MEAEFSNLSYEWGFLQENAPFGNVIRADTRLTINGSDDALF
jgi:hypothetical protein